MGLWAVDPFSFHGSCLLNEFCSAFAASRLQHYSFSPYLQRLPQAASRFSSVGGFVRLLGVGFTDASDVRDAEMARTTLLGDPSTGKSRVV